MAFKTTLRSAGGVVLAGALIFAAAPVASADQTRQDQWALKAFDAASIWKITKGHGVTVAVIDSGVNADHVDLKGNVKEGKDFIDGGSTAPQSDEDHGTGMASVIAAHGHGPGGADGVMGLAPEATILDIRDDGGDDDGFASSIRYAVDHGASVINISQEGSDSRPTEAQAIAYALQKDVLVVAGSGNEGTEAGYPARYPGVLAVGGVKNNTEIWENSNYGSEVLLTAPATFIVAAGSKSDTAYRSGTGTSDATAYVSAAAALLRAEFPDLTAGQIVTRLTKSAGLPASAKDISLPDKRYGYGFIQPLAALTRDIPAGPTYGPLAVPESLKTGQGATADPSSAAPNATGGAMSDDEQAAADRKQVIALSVIGLVGLLVLALIIFVIVKIARRNKGGDNRPGGPGGPGAPGGGYPQYGQPQPHAPQQYQPQPQPQGNPYAQNPYGGRPQTPPPSSWGSGRP